MSPIVFISGIGLLVLSMTNRLARPIDQIRQLGQKLETAAPEDHPFLVQEINQFRKRASILRTAIGLAVASILGVSVIMLLICGGLMYEVDHFYSVPILFAGSLVCLMLSLFCFMWDLRLTLDSLNIEINRQIRKGVYLTIDYTKTRAGREISRPALAVCPFCKCITGPSASWPVAPGNWPGPALTWRPGS